MLNITKTLQVALGRSEAEELRSDRSSRFRDPEGVPPVVVWNVCRHCNMECPHCYAAATASPSRFALDRDEALDVIDQLADCGVRVVIFSGGEPLMRPDLEELIRTADARGLSCHLSTNGSLLDPETARNLADAGIGYVGISIDGMPEFNDDYRGLEDGFDRATGGIRNAQAAGLRTGLRLTLTRHNLDQLDAVYEHAVDLGVDRFYVSHLLDAGRGYGMENADLDRKECRRTLRRLFEWAHPDERTPEEPDVVTGGNDSDGALLVWWLWKQAGPRAARRAFRLLASRGGNSAGVKLLNIDARGDVHPDQFWRQCTLGNVRETPVAEILDHPLRRKLARREEHIHGRCADCDFLDICGGSHRERALARTGDRWGSDPACVLTDEERSAPTAARSEVAP